MQCSAQGVGAAGELQRDSPRHQIQRGPHGKMETDCRVKGLQLRAARQSPWAWENTEENNLARLLGSLFRV